MAGDNSATEQEKNNKPCVICSEPGPFKCSRCPPNGKPHYCCAEHQKTHWHTTHKANCGSPHQPNPTGDLDSPDVCCDFCYSNISYSKQRGQSDQGLMCAECGALFCHSCTYGRLMTREAGACVTCGVACPCCSKPFGGAQIGEAFFLKTLQATSDRAPNDHKSKIIWNMWLGEKYESAGNINKAIQSFSTASAAGLPLGHAQAGRLLCDKGDLNNGRRCTLLAANDERSPSALAMHNLGCMHALGQIHGESAAEWRTKAAGWGSVASCSNAGSACLEGSSGASENKKKAAHWRQRGAEGGDFDSTHRLARRRRDGDGAKRGYALSKSGSKRQLKGRSRACATWGGFSAKAGALSETWSRRSNGFVEEPLTGGSTSGRSPS